MNMFITKPFMLIIYLSDVYRKAYMSNNIIVSRETIIDLKNSIDMCGEGKFANEIKEAFGCIKESSLKSIDSDYLDDLIYDKISRWAVDYDTNIEYSKFRREVDIVEHYQKNKGVIKKIYKLYLDQQELFKKLIEV